MFKTILLDAVLFSLLLGLFVSFIQWIDPRMELHNYPTEIRDKVPKKTMEEKKRFIKTGIVNDVAFIFISCMETFT